MRRLDCSDLPGGSCRCEHRVRFWVVVLVDVLLQNSDPEEPLHVEMFLVRSLTIVPEYYYGTTTKGPF